MNDQKLYDLLEDKDFFSHNIYIGIQRNSSQDIIKRPSELEGLEFYVYIRMKWNEETMYTIKVTKSLIKLVGMDEEKVWEYAKSNTCEETEIYSFNEMLEQCVECFISSGESVLYVLTNKCKNKGASSIIDDKKIKEFAAKHGTDKLIVCPSSIHEMILFPYNDEISEDEIESFSEMVKEINDSEVIPEERLIDRAYLITV